MADPLSVAGSVVGVVSLGIQVTQSLVDFYKSYKNRESELAGTIERLESLAETFQSLHKALSSRTFQPDQGGLVKNIETSITKCHKLIQELQDECRKYNNPSPTGFRATIRVAGCRAAYPFRRSTLQKLDEDIGEIRANLSLALNVLQLDHTQRLQDDITEMKDILELVKADHISSGLRDWLKAPDACVDHNAACAKKHLGTGLWLVKSDQFSRWLVGKNSILWLAGFAGTGKSVLCSTAVQSVLPVLRHRGYDRNIGIAFFYFTFNDDSKQSASSMIRALLLQLSSQLQDGHTELAQLHESHRIGTPPTSELLEYLPRLIQRFQHVYILLDALDESPRNGPRSDLLQALETMRKWGVQGLHLFVTSRDEMDIRESLDLPASHQILMRNAGIDQDIVDFIAGQLDGDQKLRKLSPYRNKIQEVLAKSAKGVFRWVECQLRSLQSCPRSEYHLDKVLNSLPQSLDETYERILCNIDTYCIEDARRILTLLCFAKRPLTVQELIDGIAVELESPVGLNRQRRLQDSDDLRQICLGLVDIGLGADPTRDPYEDLTLTVRIAHFSVQEYLESERIRQQKAAIFSLNSVTAHAQIAQICIVYLLEDDLCSSELDRGLVEAFPFAQFAARYWYHHYQHTVDPVPGLDCLILKLFQHRHAFTTWVKLHDEDGLRSTGVDYDRSLSKIATPVYYASLLGLDRALLELIGKEQAGSVTADVNAQGGRLGNALRAASYGGHEKVVQMLLEKGADINAQGGHYGNALQAASFGGCEKVVRMLLEKGADINAQGGDFGNALQAASGRGHEKLVQILLEKGADINTQNSGSFGNALQAASYGGYEKVVQMLLEKGADINTQGGYYGSALQAASYGGYEKVVQMLLEKGADINTQGGVYGNALPAASSGGYEKVVQMLLEKGADINTQGRYFGNALQAASSEGHGKVVQILLEKGADINTQGGHFGNALQAASYGGHEEVVQILLEKGADVNTQGGYYGNALQAASEGGNEKVVQMLLEKGADINSGDALSAASRNGHKEVVQLLLEKGADVNAQGGYYGNALQAASERGRKQMIQLLLEKGANIDQSGPDGSALQIASREGNKKVVQILLEKGADINGNALQAASERGRKQVVQLLLEKGADINSGDALSAASRKGHKEVVQLLLEKGADINGNALQAASENGHEKVVQILLERGADIDQSGPDGSALQAASLCGHEKVVQILLEKGADIDQSGPDDDSALQLASYEGHEKVMQMLLEKGAKRAKS